MTQKKEVETIDDSLIAALLVITIASLMIMIMIVTVTVTVIGKEAVAAAAAASCIGYSSVLRRHWVAMMTTASATTTTKIEKSTPKRVDTIN